MATVETRYAHIVLDERGVPHIAGTTMKVVELVTNHQAYGWGPDEDMARRLAYADEMRRNAPPHPFVTRLRGLQNDE